MKYVLRTACLDDLEAVVALCAQHAAREEAAFSSEGKREGLARALGAAVPPLHLYVVEQEGRVTGYFSFTIDFSTWDAAPFLHLDCLYLEPPMRGRGIGRSILTLLEGLALEKGCVNLQWQTPPFNEEAIAFYRKAGAVAREKLRFTYPLQQGRNAAEEAVP